MYKTPPGGGGGSIASSRSTGDIIIKRDKQSFMRHSVLTCSIILPSIIKIFLMLTPGRVAQSVGHLTRKSGVLGSIPGLATYFVSPSAFSRRAVVSYWRKYVHEVLVNR